MTKVTRLCFSQLNFSLSLFYFICAGVLLSPLAGNPCRPTRVSKAQQPQEQCYPFLPVCAVFSISVRPDNGMDVSVWDFQVDVRADVHA